MPYAYTVTVTGINNYSDKQRVDRKQLWPFTQLVWADTRDFSAALRSMGNKFFENYPTSALALPHPKRRNGIIVVTPNAAGKLPSLLQQLNSGGRGHDSASDRYFVRNDLATLSITEMPAMSDPDPQSGRTRVVELYPKDPEEYDRRLQENISQGVGFGAIPQYTEQVPGPLRSPK